MRDEAVNEIWRKWAAWSDAAGRFQSEIKRYRLIQLVLIIVGSALATCAATDMFGLNTEAADTMANGNRVIAGIGTVCLLMVGFLQSQFLTLARVERWPRCRSISETIKTEVFKFRANAKPYDAPPASTPDTALHLLSDKVASLEEKASDLLPHILRRPDSTATGPEPLDPEAYIRARLDDQIDQFFLPSARKNLRYANRARTAIIILTGIGVVITGLMSAGILTSMGAWVSVFTTISAAVATFAALSRFDYLAASYAKQAHVLSGLRSEWQTGRWKDWSAFVLACEETLSAENRAWMIEILDERATLDGVLPENSP